MSEDDSCSELPLPMSPSPRESDDGSSSDSDNSSRRRPSGSPDSDAEKNVPSPSDLELNGAGSPLLEEIPFPQDQDTEMEIPLPPDPSRYSPSQALGGGDDDDFLGSSEESFPKSKSTTAVLGKAQAKKRLLAFSAAKLATASQNSGSAGPKKISPLKPSQTMKQQQPQPMLAIATIKEEEMKIKDMIAMNSLLVDKLNQVKIIATTTAMPPVTAIVKPTMMVPRTVTLKEGIAPQPLMSLDLEVVEPKPGPPLQKDTKTDDIEEEKFVKPARKSHRHYSSSSSRSGSYSRSPSPDRKSSKKKERRSRSRDPSRERDSRKRDGDRESKKSSRRSRSPERRSDKYKDKERSKYRDKDRSRRKDSRSPSPARDPKNPSPSPSGKDKERDSDRHRDRESRDRDREARRSEKDKDSRELREREKDAGKGRDRDGRDRAKDREFRHRARHESEKDEDSEPSEESIRNKELDKIRTTRMPVDWTEFKELEYSNRVVRYLWSLLKLKTNRRGSKSRSPNGSQSPHPPEVKYVEHPTKLSQTLKIQERAKEFVLVSRTSFNFANRPKHRYNDQHFFEYPEYLTKYTKTHPNLMYGYKKLSNVGYYKTRETIFEKMNEDPVILAAMEEIMLASTTVIEPNEPKDRQEWYAASEQNFIPTEGSKRILISHLYSDEDTDNSPLVLKSQLEKLKPPVTPKGPDSGESEADDSLDSAPSPLLKQKYSANEPRSESPFVLEKDPVMVVERSPSPPPRIIVKKVEELQERRLRESSSESEQRHSRVEQSRTYEEKRGSKYERDPPKPVDSKHSRNEREDKSKTRSKPEVPVPLPESLSEMEIEPEEPVSKKSGKSKEERKKEKSAKKKSKKHRKHKKDKSKAEPSSGDEVEVETKAAESSDSEKEHKSSKKHHKNPEKSSKDKSARRKRKSKKSGRLSPESGSSSEDEARSDDSSSRKPRKKRTKLAAVEDTKEKPQEKESVSKVPAKTADSKSKDKSSSKSKKKKAEKELKKKHKKRARSTSSSQDSASDSSNESSSGEASSDDEEAKTKHKKKKAKKDKKSKKKDEKVKKRDKSPPSSDDENHGDGRNGTRPSAGGSKDDSRSSQRDRDSERRSDRGHERGRDYGKGYYSGGRRRDMLNPEELDLEDGEVSEEEVTDYEEFRLAMSLAEDEVLPSVIINKLKETELQRRLHLEQETRDCLSAFDDDALLLSVFQNENFNSAKLLERISDDRPKPDKSASLTDGLSVSNWSDDSEEELLLSKISELGGASQNSFSEMQDASDLSGLEKDSHDIEGEESAKSKRNHSSSSARTKSRSVSPRSGSPHDFKYMNRPREGDWKRRESSSRSRESSLRRGSYVPETGKEEGEPKQNSVILTAAAEEMLRDLRSSSPSRSRSRSYSPRTTGYYKHKYESRRRLEEEGAHGGPHSKRRAHPADNIELPSVKEGRNHLKSVRRRSLSHSRSRSRSRSLSPRSRRQYDYERRRHGRGREGQRFIYSRGVRRFHPYHYDRRDGGFHKHRHERFRTREEEERYHRDRAHYRDKDGHYREKDRHRYDDLRYESEDRHVDLRETLTPKVRTEEPKSSPPLQLNVADSTISDAELGLPSPNPAGFIGGISSEVFNRAQQFHPDNFVGSGSGEVQAATPIPIPPPPVPPPTTTASAACASPPRRLSLDERLEMEMGIKLKDDAPKPINHYYPPPFFQHQFSQPPPSHPYGVPPPNHMVPTGMEGQAWQFPEQVRPGFEKQAAYPGPQYGGFGNQPRHHSQIIQVGNMLQVVPAELSTTPITITSTVPTPRAQRLEIMNAANAGDTSGKVSELGSSKRCITIKVPIVPFTVPYFNPPSEAQLLAEQEEHFLRRKKRERKLRRLKRQAQEKRALKKKAKLEKAEKEKAAAAAAAKTKPEVKPPIVPLPADGMEEVSAEELALLKEAMSETPTEDTDDLLPPEESIAEGSQGEEKFKSAEDAPEASSRDDMREADEGGETCEPEPQTAEDNEYKVEPVTLPVRKRIEILPAPSLGILVAVGFRERSTTERKAVKFADGINPGYGSSPSGGEEMPSPPPPAFYPYKKSVSKDKKKKRGRGKGGKAKGSDLCDDADPPPCPSVRYPFCPTGILYQVCPQYAVLYAQAMAEKGIDIVFEPSTQQPYSGQDPTLPPPNTATPSGMLTDSSIDYSAHAGGQPGLPASYYPNSMSAPPSDSHPNLAQPGSRIPTILNYSNNPTGSPVPSSYSYGAPDDLDPSFRMEIQGDHGQVPELDEIPLPEDNPNLLLISPTKIPIPLGTPPPILADIPLPEKRKKKKKKVLAPTSGPITIQLSKIATASSRRNLSLSAAFAAPVIVQHQHLYDFDFTAVYPVPPPVQMPPPISVSLPPPINVNGPPHLNVNLLPPHVNLPPPLNINVTACLPVPAKGLPPGLPMPAIPPGIDLSRPPPSMTPPPPGTDQHFFPTSAETVG